LIGKRSRPLDHLADVLAADRRRDDRLHVGDREPVARRGRAVDVDVDVAARR
jgi:hypothetical protein